MDKIYNPQNDDCGKHQIKKICYEVRNVIGQPVKTAVCPLKVKDDGKYNPLGVKVHPYPSYTDLYTTENLHTKSKCSEHDQRLSDHPVNNWKRRGEETRKYNPLGLPMVPTYEQDPCVRVNL